MLLTVPPQILHALLLQHGLRLSDIAVLATACTSLHAAAQPLLDACAYHCSACGHSIVHPKHVTAHATGQLSKVFGSPCNPGHMLPGVVAVSSTASSLQLQYGEERSCLDGQLRRVLASEHKDPAFHDPTAMSIRVQVASCPCCSVMLGLRVCSIHRLSSQPSSPTGTATPRTSCRPELSPDGTVPPFFWCQRVPQQCDNQSEISQQQHQQYGVVGQVLLCMRALVFKHAPLSSAAAAACTASGSGSSGSLAVSSPQVFKCQGKRSSFEALLPDSPASPTAGSGSGCGNLLFTFQDVMGSCVASDKATGALRPADLVAQLHNKTYKLDVTRVVRQMQGDDAQVADVRCAQCGEIIGCKLLKLDAGVGIQNGLRVGRFIIYQAATTATCAEQIQD